MSRLLLAVAISIVVGASAIADTGINFVLTNPAETGLDYDQTCGWSCSATIGDFDNDGWPDVCLAGSSTAGIKLYRNNGDGTFSNVSDVVLPQGTINATMALFVDLDNDGDLELVFAREFGSDQDIGFGCLTNRSGVYEMVPVPDDLTRQSRRLGGLAAADYDFDGDADIFKTHYRGHCYVLRNDGDSAITDVSESVGVGLYERRTHWTAVLADFNNDRRSDLHLAIDLDHDMQFRNQGGTFVDFSAQANLNRIGSDMGVAVGDIENDGDLDIYSTNIGFHALYVNDGTGRFDDEAAARGVLRSNPIIGIGWGTVFSDFDNDGDLDLAMTDAVADGAVFENDGTGHFTNVSDMLPTLSGRGLVAFDFDRDGDLDLLNTYSSGSPHLLENTSLAAGDNHWLSVRLRGTFSNSDGIGARVEVMAGGATMIREVMCGTSYLSAGPMELHFGLGAADTADAVRVTWPSGVIQYRMSVAGDRAFDLLEDDPDFDGNGVCDLDDLAILLNNYGLNPATQPQGDATHDGRISLVDLAAFLTAYANRPF